MNTNDLEEKYKEKRKNETVPNSFIARYGTRIGLPLLVIGLVLVIVGIVRVFTQSNDTRTSSSDLVISLKPVGQLVTLQAKAAKVGVKFELRTGLCTASAEYLVNSTIKAGVDLTSFSEANITYNEKSDNYRITMPYPKLTGCEPNLKRYSENQNLLCADIDYDKDLVSISSYVMATEIRDDLIDGGILERAKRETTVLMQQLVKSLTGKSAEIVFDKPESKPIYPAACNLSKPAGWEQDSSGKWIKNG